MTKNKPVVATATVRAFVKKSGINYLKLSVSNITSLSGQTFTGITVWQSGNSILFNVVGNSDLTNAENLAKFANVLASNGYTFNQRLNSYEVVKAGA